MKKLTIDQFKELVNKRAGIFIDGPRGQWHFHIIDLDKVVEEKEQFELDKIEILPKKNPINWPDDVIMTCDGMDELVAFLKTEAYIKNGFLSANKSFHDLIEEDRFENITMKDLLVKYHACEIFSLTCPYNDGYDELHPYGKYSIPQQLADDILSQIIDENQNLYDYYEMMPKRFRSKHTFEHLMEETRNESLALYQRVINNQLEADESPYACDMFISGKAKFKSPQQLWHFYHTHDLINQKHAVIASMLKNTESRPITFALEEPYYEPLKKSYFKSDIGFSWHCTTSSALSITNYFKMDEHAKSWLSQLKDDYDMKALEDLAFYYKGHLAFSSCTHEHFHHDYLEQAKKDAQNEL